MNKKIQGLMKEKDALYAHKDAFKNTTLLDKELLSIAKAVLAIFEKEVKEPTPEDEEARKWAEKEAAWEWR